MSWVNGRKTQRDADNVGGALSVSKGASPDARDRATTPLLAHSLPRFQATASDYLDKAGDRVSAVRLKLRKAFTPAQPITDRWMFAGRNQVLSRIITGIEDQRLHTVLYGPRGIGKTSILHVLSQIARDAKYQVVYASCGSAASFDEMFRAVASEIPLMFHEAYGPTSPEAEKGGTVADLLPAGPISPRMASDICARLAGTRVLVVLDEFDRCRSAEFPGDVAEFLKNLSDRTVRVQLVIAGVANNLEDLIEPDPMIQRNVLALEVPRMPTEEVIQLISNGETMSGLGFDEAAKQQLQTASVGLPYLASLLSQHAGLTALSAGRLSVTAADVAVGIDTAINEIKSRMPRRALAEINRCAQDGTLQLLARLSQVAQLPKGEFTDGDIAALYSDPAHGAQATAAIKRLAAGEVLVQRVGDDTAQRFCFADESGLPYLWLLAGKAHLRPGEGAGSPTPARS